MGIPVKRPTNSGTNHSRHRHHQKGIFSEEFTSFVDQFQICPKCCWNHGPPIRNWVVYHWLPNIFPRKIWLFLPSFSLGKWQFWRYLQHPNFNTSISIVHCISITIDGEIRLFVGQVQMSILCWAVSHHPMLGAPPVCCRWSIARSIWAAMGFYMWAAWSSRPARG